MSQIVRKSGYPRGRPWRLNAIKQPGAFSVEKQISVKFTVAEWTPLFAFALSENVSLAEAVRRLIAQSLR